MNREVLKMLVQPGKRDGRLTGKKNLYEAVYEAKNKLSIYEIPEYLEGLLKNPYFKNSEIVKCPFPKIINEIGKGRIFANSGDLSKEISWSIFFINKYVEKINFFLQKKKKFTNSLFEGKLIKAQEILNEIEKEIGISYWLLENKIFLIHQLDGLESQKEFVNEIQKEKSQVHVFIKFILGFISAKIEDNLPYDKYDLLIKETLQIQKDNDIPERIIEYLKYKLYCQEYIKYDHIPTMLFESNLSIIDRYITLIKVLRQLEENDDSIDIINLVRKYSSEIDDENNLRLLGKNTFNNSELLEVWDLYNSGQYNEVIKRSKQILKFNPDCVDVYPIFVKARIYIESYESVFNNDSFLDNILNHLENIYLSNSRFDESKSELLKIIYTFHYDEWTWQLRGLINDVINLDSNEISDFTIEYAENMLPDNPSAVLYNVGDRKAETQLIFLEQKDANPSSVTMNLFEAIISNDLESLEELLLPKYRKDLCSAKIKLNLGKYREAKASFKKIQCSDNRYISLRGKVGVVNCCIYSKSYSEAVKIVVDAFVQDGLLIRQFPIKRLIESIEEDEYDEELRSDISLSILYDIYSKHFSYEKDPEKIDACEDFLLTMNLTKPSEIDFSKLEGIYKKESILYYLKHLCVENVIDNYPVFENSEEVENERISVCRILSKHDPENSYIYQEEIKKITQKQIIKRGLREVERSKIYVDTEGIKNSLYKTNKENFQRFKSLVDSNKGEQTPGFYHLEENFDYDGQSVDLMIPTDEKQQLLYRIVFDTRDSFVSSNEFGLDGYLSVGIRHGTLSGQLRAPLEQDFLITQKDVETDLYQLANYWTDMFTERQQNVLIPCFDKFGKTIDSIITKLRKEWIQISTEKNKSEGLFNFILTIEELEKLEKTINDKTTYEELMDLIINMLWEKTDNSLRNIRHMIKTTLKEEFENAFTSFISNLEDIKDSVDTSDIKAKIIETQTTIQYEIEKISNWFTRNKTSQAADYTIDLPIDIALEWVENIYNNQQIKLVSKNIDKFKLKGRTLKSLCDIAFILFDNIIKHSNLDGLIHTSISIETNGSQLVLKCQNEVNESVISREKKQKLEDYRDKLQSETEYDNVNIEGGSGFYKIQKIISVDLNWQHKLEFYFDETECEFIVCLTIDIE